MLYFGILKKRKNGAIIIVNASFSCVECEREYFDINKNLFFFCSTSSWICARNEPYVLRLNCFNEIDFNAALFYFQRQKKMRFLAVRSAMRCSSTTTTTTIYYYFILNFRDQSCAQDSHFGSFKFPSPTLLIRQCKCDQYTPERSMKEEEEANPSRMREYFTKFHCIIMSIMYLKLNASFPLFPLFFAPHRVAVHGAGPGIKYIN